MTTLPAVREQEPAESELAGLARLAGEGAGALVARVQELHEAVAARSFGATPASAAPRATHDAIAGSVYAGLRVAGRALGAGIVRGIEAAGGGPALSEHPRGRIVQGALNGWIGDRLHTARSPLRVEMAVRASHRDLPLDEPEAVAAAFPDATARPVVFVHGLGESDAAWRLRAAERGGTYATRVLPEVGGTAVHLRYNSGLRVSQNGRRLSALLEALVAAWPVEIEDLSLVGHSMGGLVIRSAGHAAGEGGHAWPALVRTTVGLGTPHLGAPLEQAVGLATAALSAVPEARPIAAVLASRSAGIKDLRHGSLVDAEWERRHPDAWGGFERVEVPLLEGAAHHMVAATLTERPDHPVARMLGDLLVHPASAHGRHGERRVIAFEEDSCRHVGGHDHFDLLNSPSVDPLLRAWLAPPA